ncbi:uncharacterized protein LOC111407884 [Olea europaea var. sylvestris]|uniref:uncharacterized protein LOC111407884 n=1 Tax=Olea europaea var. sylvestris TaxID=158386 RepID=UPI000C1D1333|nr:uncharacterized protein LOC111407884 [Olea europaea var. sylvestris]XP_022893349.1 uncharacterized protein LOC111407884 [Olea europaea var. sylvestris]
MNYRLGGQNQRPRGLKVKRGSQYALILAIFIWFLYWINCSHDETEHYARSSQRKLGEEHDAVILGCKVNVGWLTGRGDPESVNANFMTKSENNEASARAHELTKIPREKAKNKIFYLERQGSSLIDERDDRKNFERLKEISSYKGHHKSSLQSALADSQKVSETDVKKIENGGGISGTETKEKDEHEFALEVEGENVTSDQQHETENGVHGFDDENGVPQDFNDVTQSQV